MDIKSVLAGFMGGGPQSLSGGFMKRAAMVDLGSGRISDYPISDEEYMKFLGGKGLAAHILLRELPALKNPLGEENVLIFSGGVLTGTGAPTSGRFNATSKSPLTGAIGHSNSGGDFGTFLKKCGYDALIIKGRASGPVYIDITDDKIEIKDAKHMWGLDTVKTQAELGGGKKTGTLVIGPAGENLVRFASIMSGHRVLGRIGLGAVMGSKHLKAVKATGDRKIPIGDPERFKDVLKMWTRILREHAITGYQLPRMGTAGLVNMTNATCTLPVHNFSRGRDPRAWEISGETMREKMLIKNIGCRFCPIRCGRWINFKGKEIKGPEYETLALMGSNLDNFDLEKIASLSQACDILGMDTISAGGVLGYVMELNEKGLLKSDIRFGKTDNLEKALEDIAYRRDLGDEMAEGSMRMSEKYGGEDYAIHAKGLELPGYEPRRSLGQGLGYAVSNRGGCHLNSGYFVFMEALGPAPVNPLAVTGKAELNVIMQNLFDAISSAGTCIFTAYAVVPSGMEENVVPYSRMAATVANVLAGAGFALSTQARLPMGMLKINIPLIPHPMAVGAAMGVNFTAGDFLMAGERVYNIEKMFNLREGFSRADDRLPGRLVNEPQDPDNPGTKVPLDELLPTYYKTRGWDSNGIPKDFMLRKLGLGELLPLGTEIRRNIEVARYKRHKLRKDQDNLVHDILKARGG
jgi:aldehyde:ferredoxin oxidoreductase